MLVRSSLLALLLCGGSLARGGEPLFTAEQEALFAKVRAYHDARYGDDLDRRSRELARRFGWPTIDGVPGCIARDGKADPQAHRMRRLMDQVFLGLVPDYLGRSALTDQPIEYPSKLDGEQTAAERLHRRVPRFALGHLPLSEAQRYAQIRRGGARSPSGEPLAVSSIDGPWPVATNLERRDRQEEFFRKHSGLIDRLTVQLPLKFASMRQVVVGHYDRSRGLAVLSAGIQPRRCPNRFPMLNPFSLSGHASTLGIGGSGGPEPVAWPASMAVARRFEPTVRRPGRSPTYNRIYIKDEFVLLALPNAKTREPSITPVVARHLGATLYADLDRREKLHDFPARTLPPSFLEDPDFRWGSDSVAADPANPCDLAACVMREDPDRFTDRMLIEYWRAAQHADKKRYEAMQNENGRRAGWSSDHASIVQSRASSPRWSGAAPRINAESRPFAPEGFECYGNRKSELTPEHSQLMRRFLRDRGRQIGRVRMAFELKREEDRVAINRSAESYVSGVPELVTYAEDRAFDVRGLQAFTSAGCERSRWGKVGDRDGPHLRGVIALSRGMNAIIAGLPESARGKLKDQWRGMTLVVDCELERVTVTDSAASTATAVLACRPRAVELHHVVRPEGFDQSWYALASRHRVADAPPTERQVAASAPTVEPLTVGSLPVLLAAADPSIVKRRAFQLWTHSMEYDEAAPELRGTTSPDRFRFISVLGVLGDVSSPTYVGTRSIPANPALQRSRALYPEWLRDRAASASFELTTTEYSFGPDFLWRFGPRPDLPLMLTAAIRPDCDKEPPHEIVAVSEWEENNMRPSMRNLLSGDASAEEIEFETRGLGSRLQSEFEPRRRGGMRIGVRAGGAAGTAVREPEPFKPYRPGEGPLIDVDLLARRLSMAPPLVFLDDPQLTDYRQRLSFPHRYREVALEEFTRKGDQSPEGPWSEPSGLIIAIEIDGEAWLPAGVEAPSDGESAVRMRFRPTGVRYVDRPPIHPWTLAAAEAVDARDQIDPEDHYRDEGDYAIVTVELLEATLVDPARDNAELVQLEVRPRRTVE